MLRQEDLLKEIICSRLLWSKTKNFKTTKSSLNCMSLTSLTVICFMCVWEYCKCLSIKQLYSPPVAEIKHTLYCSLSLWLRLTCLSWAALDFLDWKELTPMTWELSWNGLFACRFRIWWLSPPVGCYTFHPCQRPPFLHSFLTISSSHATSFMKPPLWSRWN